MSKNPYESPTVFPTQAPGRTRGAISYLVTSVVTGSFVGAGAMFCYSFFFVAPIWGQTMYKGDERWETIFFIASVLLPISVIVGIVLALVAFRFNSYRMRHREILISCLVLWFLISANRPVVSRIRRPDIPAPKFETVPDSMVAIVWVLFTLTVVSGLIQWLSKRNQNPMPSDGITSG